MKSLPLEWRASIRRASSCSSLWLNRTCSKRSASRGRADPASERSTFRKENTLESVNWTSSPCARCRWMELHTCPIRNRSQCRCRRFRPTKWIWKCNFATGATKFATGGKQLFLLWLRSNFDVEALYLQIPGVYFYSFINFCSSFWEVLVYFIMEFSQKSRSRLRLRLYKEGKAALHAASILFDSKPQAASRFLTKFFDKIEDWILPGTSSWAFSFSVILN